MPEVILSRDFADKLFPGENPLGKVLYDTLGQPATVIGITEPVQGSWASAIDNDYVLFMPRVAYTWGGPMKYMVRTRPGLRDRIMRQAQEYLSTSNPKRLIDSVYSMQRFKANAYRSDRNMGIYLVTVTALLRAITCLGIFCLATFNVSTRTKQIGTRRAVGARRLGESRHGGVCLYCDLLP